MQIKVTTNFVSGVTGKSYHIGELCDVTDALAAEYIGGKLAVAVKPPTPPAPPKPPVVKATAAEAKG